MAHPGPLQRLTRLLRHRWADGRLRRVLTPEVLQRLGQRVAASERRHTGQIRICAEGGLPLSYLWRGASARERAITQFGKLRVWDTEHNNGVLIYLLLAETPLKSSPTGAWRSACPRPPGTPWCSAWARPCAPGSTKTA